MLGVYWSAVNRITTLLYLMIIISLPFSTTFSTILLFGLFSFWTRLPGMGIPVFGWWLLMLDTVDIFSLLIAVQIGGFSGGVFSVFVNIGSAAIGKYTNWNVCIKDAIAQFLVCLFIPGIHYFTQNIIVTMIWYTILRALLFIPMWFVYHRSPWPKFMVELVFGTFALTSVNSVYAGIFGALFDDILQEGVRFSWPLFLIMTIIVLTGRFYFKKIGRKNRVLL